MLGDFQDIRLATYILSGGLSLIIGAVVATFFILNYLSNTYLKQENYKEDKNMFNKQQEKLEEKTTKLEEKYSEMNERIIRIDSKQSQLIDQNNEIKKCIEFIMQNIAKIMEKL